MDEGVAQWEDKAIRDGAVKIVKELIREDRIIPLSELMQIDIRKENNFELARSFYAQAVSVVGYLVKQYGGQKFTLFCRQLRDGKDINQALSFTYTTSIHNIKELEKKWIKYYERRD